MVIMRLLRLSMVRVAITANTLHPNPIISRMNDLPCKPILCINLSIINAVRTIYPKSSISNMKKYRIRICGRNTMIPPTLFIIPLVSKSANGPGAKFSCTSCSIQLIQESIHPLGYSPMTKVASNMSHRKKMNREKPSNLLVAIWSINFVLSFLCMGFS